jgi:hypothetical protein
MVIVLSKWYINICHISFSHMIYYSLTFFSFSYLSLILLFCYLILLHILVILRKCDCFISYRSTRYITISDILNYLSLCDSLLTFIISTHILLVILFIIHLYHQIIVILFFIYKWLINCTLYFLCLCQLTIYTITYSSIIKTVNATSTIITYISTTTVVTYVCISTNRWWISFSLKESFFIRVWYIASLFLS